ncbi:Cbwd1 [Symbiodinium necroappetens]|uniref:Cbwd1 protein n=1 Tax=Symbiodinium necroappetens TaxID=1628268 RepID=A0A813BV75_9DINO|nr:Cbwd1 [Symbiodinium necroappetens]
MAPPLQVLAAFMQFTVSLYPDQVHYVDIILGSAAELLQKFKALPGCSGPISEKAADQIGELLAGPMKTLGLGVLKMEHFAGLVSFLNFEIRKQVSLNMVTAIVEVQFAISADTRRGTSVATLKEGKFFDAVQHINACMQAFAKVLGDDSDKILKDPPTFIAEMVPKVSAEQKDTLRQMYELRGDIITGLGAHKRAASDYECAQQLGSTDGALKDKVAQVQAAMKAKPSESKVPVTVLTGFLGSGKTTLLNRILHENHGKRIGIIENEFGEVGIDDGLIEAGSIATQENIIEMNNGCICCTVRGDLIAGLKKMIKNAVKNNKPLDGVIIETTGLADPAPVAQTFFADDFVQQKMSLDGIVTLVDAKHLIPHLDEEKPEGVENEAVEQLAFADRVVLNKCDLVDEPQLVEVERRIRMINESVKIRRATQSKVDMDFILGIQAFSLDKILEMDDAFLEDNQDHQHDDRVTSCGFHVKGEVDQQKLNDWLGMVLKEKGADLFRTKGVLAVKGMKEKFVFQAVHMAFTGSPQGPWGPDEERVCKLTFIGKNINREELEANFRKCLVGGLPQKLAPEATVKEGKFFDAVQHINACMQAFAKVLGDDSDKILKDPPAFIAEMVPKVSAEQKDTLRQMYELRGDILTGLGAHKRAASDYECAQQLGGALKDKVEQVQALKKAKLSESKVPVTVLTGFLGSGKTTLLNRILHENHGKRIGIIENEFGEVGIDDGLIEAGSIATQENIIEMNNGCICCTVRGDLIAGLKKMIKNAVKNNKPLDGVIIETTGLADPAPVAQTFFADDFVQQKMSLDGIVTLVDAKHLIPHLDEEKPEGVENEAVEQLAFADRIVLNKCDLVDEPQLVEVERRIRMINESVKIRRATQSKVDMDFILGIQAFSLDKILEMDDAFLEDNQDHQHDDRVTSCGFHVKGEVDQQKLNGWLGKVLQEKGNDLFRTKGVLAVKGLKEKFVFQAVHMAFTGSPQRPWGPDEERVCKLTFIGKNINREELEDDRALSSVDDVTALFGFIAPLLKDEEDTPMDEAKDKARFAEEQHKVCKLVHQVRHEDSDVEFQILTTMRGFFGQGGPNRLVFTLQPIFFAALGLVPKILAREKRRAEEGDEAVPPPAVSMKKVFQFVHKTNTALMQSSPDMALHLWLAAAVSADQVERATGAQGGYEPIAYEFLTQALVLFEEEISDSSKQYKGIHNIVGTLCKIAALDPENFDNVSQKITRHAAKLLKKPMQCRAVSACSQLFWCDARRDGKRVRECLERCVKTCEAVVQSDSAQVGLWVEMFDRYIYYYEVQCEEVGITFLQSLMQICVEHIDFALKDAQAEAEARKAKAFNCGFYNFMSASHANQKGFQVRLMIRYRSIGPSMPVLPSLQ